MVIKPERFHLACGAAPREMECVLRCAEGDDIHYILALSRTTDRFDISECENEIDDEELSYWISDPRSIVIVAVLGSQIVGYAYGICISKKWFFFDEFLVAAEVRGCGIGDKMYTFLRKACIAQNIELIQGLVIDGDDAMLDYWIDKGFKPGKKCIWVEDWLNPD